MLVITWRNPLPPTRAEGRVRRAIDDRFGSVYLVTREDATQQPFELYPGGRTTLTSCAGASRKVGNTQSHVRSGRRGEERGEEFLMIAEREICALELDLAIAALSRCLRLRRRCFSLHES